MKKINSCLFIATTTILFLVNYVTEAQVLNRQMLAAQGKSVILENGVMISQSIGQQSVIGSFSSPNVTVQQGFQQSVEVAFENAISFSSSFFSTQLYPNPVLEDLNIKFAEEVQEPVTVSIFDMGGRLLYTHVKPANGDLLSVHPLGFLPQGNYVVQLTGSNYSHSAKIIKQ